MKVTYSKLLEVLPALGEIAQKDIDVKEALELARLIKLCQNEIGLFEEQRLKLCEKHGKLNDSKTNYDFSDDGARAFSAEFSKMLSVEVNIPGKKVTIKAKALKIKAASVLACEDFVKFVE